MYSLSICFGAVVWSLRFKTEENATKALAVLRGTDPVIAVVDDYGQDITVKTSSICGIMLEDLKKSREAHIEQMLHNSAIQQEAQKRAQTRPQSPSIVTPVPFNPR